jgi:hypothetical protein
LRWRAVERGRRVRKPQPEKEHAMIAAFALAIVGIVALGTVQLAAHAR